MDEGQLILVAGALLAAGIGASLLAGRLRVPGLVLFLAVGMIAGSDVSGLIPFDDNDLARLIGVIALSLILFEGGLSTGYREIRPVLGLAISLALLGTAMTALVAGLAATWLFDVPLEQGLLIGSIVASTDGAAIFALLRGSTLKRRLAHSLEAEAGFNDPVAVLLVLGFIGVIQDGDGAGAFALLFVEEILIGLAIGLLVGRAAVSAFGRVRLDAAGLYPVASIATVAIAYGSADALHGSGFLAVYLAGLALGSARIPAKRTVVAFHEGMAWVGQLAMFLVLGLLVFPSQLDDVAVQGTVLGLVIVFVARPAAVWFATALAGDLGQRDRIVLTAAGLRGAVPIVLATFPVIEGVPGSERFFDIVFFAVLVSTVVQGFAFEPLARRMGATTDAPALPRPLAESGTIRRLGAEVVEVPVAPGDAIVGARVRDLDLPRAALVNVIVRDRQALPPRGATRLLAGDRLHVLVRAEVARDVEALVERWRTGPIGPPPRTRRPPRTRAPIFHVRPWDDALGDPSAPGEIDGRAVVERLRIRRDLPGALVRLADGDLAICGPQLALGSPAQLTAWARRRLAAAPTPAAAEWFEELVGTLAGDDVR